MEWDLAKESDPVGYFLNLVDQATKKVTVRSEMKKLGTFASRLIRVRTRLGFGVAKDEQPRYKFSGVVPIQKSTIRQRRAYKKYGDLSQFTTPGRTNLTLTGQMLGSLRGFGPAIGKFEVRATGTNVKKPLTGNGKTFRVKNSDLVGYMQNGDLANNRQPRPFLKLSNNEVRQVQIEFARRLNNEIIGLLTKALGGN